MVCDKGTSQAMMLGCNREGIFMKTIVTTQNAIDYIRDALKPELREAYNYEAVAQEANDNRDSYGIAEYEVPAHHTFLGRPFVARF